MRGRRLATLGSLFAVVLSFALPPNPALAHGPPQAPGPPLLVPGAAGAQGVLDDPALVGAFGEPFSEAGPNCEPRKNAEGGPLDAERGPRCKPTAVSAALLPTGRILYWDGLEATEGIQSSVAAEYGYVSGNSQSRVLELSGPQPTWSRPQKPRGGGPPNRNTYIFPDAPPPLDAVWNHRSYGSSSLFCSSQVLLENGDVLTTGGTSYYQEPHLPGTRYGVAELEGLRHTRLYDTSSNAWATVGRMRWGRWYPTLVTLGNGDVFVASGVTKLNKPFYPDRPGDGGSNVRQTETYRLSEGRWRYNGPSADRSLPLYPRLHLLPDGTVYYDAAGQVFNPWGQAYDEAVWNLAAVYDPRTRTWRDLGIPGAGTPAAGFRGSTFSVMLPLEPPYTQAAFLTAGGILGVTPGTYVATNDSRINTVDLANGGALSSAPTLPMSHPRWYSSGVLLPTGQVMAFSGADRDEVAFPGTGFPVRQAELFDPTTGTWTPMAAAHRDRTYHNSAVLLPDGRVLVGGHAPIPTLYGSHNTLPGGFSNNFRDPSFEIYSPPYLFWGERPVIEDVSSTIEYDSTLTITTPDAPDIEQVVLMRNTASTHLVDADQRSVVLRIVGKTDRSVTVETPPNGNVAPHGPYLLFLNERTARGLIPSPGKQVFVDYDLPSAPMASPPPAISPAGEGAGSAGQAPKTSGAAGGAGEPQAASGGPAASGAAVEGRTGRGDGGRSASPVALVGKLPERAPYWLVGGGVGVFALAAILRRRRLAR